MISSGRKVSVDEHPVPVFRDEDQVGVELEHTVATSANLRIVAPTWHVDRVQLRYAYRLDPTPGQRIALAKAFGCARVVFNDAVAARRAARERDAPYPSDAELSRALTAAKRTPERAWLGEVSAVVLQQAL